MVPMHHAQLPGRFLLYLSSRIFAVHFLPALVTDFCTLQYLWAWLFHQWTSIVLLRSFYVVGPSSWHKLP